MPTMPAFSLPGSDGATYSAKSLAGSPYILYFYPRDMTPGCTTESCDFRDHHADLRKLGVKVFGVSADTLDSHAKFIAKSKLGIGLLSDLPGADGVPPVCAKFGAWGEKSMYGKAYQGVLRTTFLIDPKGLVRARWDAVRVPGHAAAVREQLSLLAGTPVRTTAKARPVAKKKTKAKGRRGG